MDTTKSNAAHAHPSTEDHDDTVEAHYSGLERLRPCACLDGWVLVGYIDEHGEEREASYVCRRCADSSHRTWAGGNILLVERNHPPGEPGERRRYAAMHARMSTLEGAADEMDEGLRDVKEHVLPLLKQQDGFKGFIALGNRQSGELIGITFWESEQAMQASEELGDRTRSETAEATGEAIEDVERYDVGLFEMSD